MSKAINIFLSLKPAFKIRTALNNINYDMDAKETGESETSQNYTTNEIVLIQNNQKIDNKNILEVDS